MKKCLECGNWSVKVLSSQEEQCLAYGCSYKVIYSTDRERILELEKQVKYLNTIIVEWSRERGEL